MHTILLPNTDYIYFVYGLSLIVLGLSVLPLSRYDEKETRWNLLANFAFFHALNEFLAILALAIEGLTFLPALRTFLSTTSFVFLFEFGRLSVRARLSRRSLTFRALSPLLTALLIACALTGLRWGPDFVNVFFRYFLALPACVLASVVMFSRARQSLETRLLWISSGIMFLIYAFAAAIFVTKLPWGPASVLNGDTFSRWFGIPVLIPRTLIMATLAYLFSEYLLRLHPSAPTTAPSVLSRLWPRHRWIAILMTLLLGVGGWLVSLTGDIGRSLTELRTERAFKLVAGNYHHLLDSTHRIGDTIAGDPAVSQFLKKPTDRHLAEHVNALLDRFATATPNTIMYVLNAEGTTIATSNRHAPDSFLGKSYAIRPYFKTAIAGSHGEYLAVGLTSKVAGYYAAVPVFDPQHLALGVIAIKTNLLREELFNASEFPAALISPDGVVLVASNPDWEQAPLWPLATETREKLLASKQFPALKEAPLFSKQPAPRESLKFHGKEFQYLQEPSGSPGWSLALFDYSRTVAAMRGIAILVTGLLIAITLSMISTLLRRLRMDRERRELTAQLLHSERLASIGTLAAGTAHEINNPLAIIRGLLDILTMRCKKIPDSDPLLEIIDRQRKAVERISVIVTGLRSFARADTDDSQVVDLHTITSETLSFVGEVIRKRDINVETDLRASSARVLGNTGKFQQVLVNLLTNAADALEGLPRERRVTISTQVDGDRVIWAVSDTGEGIPREVIKRIFDPFFTTKPAGKGTGLGLSISRTIVEQYQGTMEVESHADRGTTFRMRFRVLPD